jgi:diacylglycerol O-acyltransferase
LVDGLRGVLSSLSFSPKPAVESLNGPIGPHRRWSWVHSNLADVKEVRAALGGTVNDVVLTAITRGFRDLLRSRGLAIEGRVVRTLVPVSVRSQAERGTLNNRVSGVLAELPVGLPHPVQRLKAMSAQMAGLKDSRQAMAGDALTSLSGFSPAMWLSLSARLGARLPQRLIQTATTNVPGPQTPLYILSRELLTSYPYVPIVNNVRISIAIFSYNGGLTFGVTGDYDSVPDLDVLCQGIEAGLAELLDAARKAQGKPARQTGARRGAARTGPPPERRRSARQRTTTTPR